MKILTGKYKGKNFYMPKGIRPTQNMLRKAVFDIFQGQVEKMDVLELFAGSGAFGLEAISNGVKKIVMVEKDPKNIACIKDNIELLSIPMDEEGNFPYEVIMADAFATIKQMAAKNRKFDLIFCDPPYGQGLAKKALNVISNYDILHPSCTVLFEHEKREAMPEKEGMFLLLEQRKYGMSVLSIYKLSA